MWRLIHVGLTLVHPTLLHGEGAQNPGPLPVSRLQSLVFAGNFPHALYKIILAALAGILRVLSAGDLVSRSEPRSPES